MRQVSLRRALERHPESRLVELGKELGETIVRDADALAPLTLEPAIRSAK